MSGKVLKPLLIGAAIIAVGVATGGIGLVGTAAITSGAGLSATVALGTTLSTTAFGSLLLTAAASTALSGVSSALAKSPKATLSALERLGATINPSAPRKMVFGTTAMATDIRYVEPSGTDQEYIDYIICVAAHRVNSIQQLWIDDLLAWTSGGGAQGKFVGYLTVDAVLEGTALNYIPINGGAKWGATRRLTGCAYIHVRIKRTGNSKKAESPFVSGLSSRLTIIGEGMPLYDPRFDSTVAGGSGPQRANDQTTWAFNASGLDQGNNIALQTLATQIGWRINGKLSVGAGTPSSRINLASYITGANLCDEDILRSDGATERRYTGAGVFTEADDPGSTLNALMIACNGALRDAGGKLEIIVRHNDLAASVVDLTDDDILGPGTWEPVPDLQEAYNVVRGRYCDPSANSLYQLVDYPEVRLDSPDGIDRVMTLDLPLVDGAARAQRIAKQVLQRRQYQGKFTGEFGARAWNAKVGDVVRVTLSAAGWVNKLFRVEGQGISMTGSCPMILREESPAIYLWEADDRAPVSAAPPTVYDPTNAPFIRALYTGDVTYADGTKIEDLKPAEPGATAGGLTPDEQAAFDQLEADTAQALIDIAAAQAQIADIEGTISVDISDLQARVLAAEGTIVTNTSDITANASNISTVSTVASTTAGNLATLTVRVGAAEATIDTNSTAISTQGTQIATLTSQISTANSNISLNATAITTLQGSQATLASTVTAQGASITSLTSATSTLTGQVATLNTTVSAGAPNLIPNGGFENGAVGWSGLTGIVPASAAAGWGQYGSVAATGVNVVYPAFIDINPTSTYTFSADIEFLASAGSARINIEWWDSAGTTLIGYSASAAKALGGGFSTDLDGRVRVSGVAPPGAGKARPRFVTGEASIAGLVNLGIRQVKFEKAAQMSAYSADASIVQSFSTLSTLTTNYASLSSTVAVQGVSITSNTTAISTANGNITTLFARYGVELDVSGYVTGFVLNNNGSRGDFTIRADKFSIVAPGGGARTEYSGGNWRVYDSTGTLRTRNGVW